MSVCNRTFDSRKKSYEGVTGTSLNNVSPMKIRANMNNGFLNSGSLDDLADRAAGSGGLTENKPSSRPRSASQAKLVFFAMGCYLGSRSARTLSSSCSPCRGIYVSLP